MHYIRHMWNATSESNVKPELNRQMFQSQIQETLPRMYNKNKCPGEELLLKQLHIIITLFSIIVLKLHVIIDMSSSGAW